MKVLSWLNSNARNLWNFGSHLGGELMHGKCLWKYLSEKSVDFERGFWVDLFRGCNSLVGEWRWSPGVLKMGNFERIEWFTMVEF